MFVMDQRQFNGSMVGHMDPLQVVLDSIVSKDVVAKVSLFV